VSDDIQEIAERIAAARRLTVLTGAGVSAASGVPTFRGAGGLWRSFRPEDLATPLAFMRNPQLVWEWYDWRRGLIARCQPNAAHEQISRWSERDGFTLITQNVDGLHERAGTRNAIRYHGSIWRLQCTRECGAAEWEDLRPAIVPLPPTCTSCGALARPAVVWFGESIDPSIAARADAATVCDVFLSIGTSSVVYPAAGLFHAAKARGAFTVEINPQATEAADLVDATIAMAAEEALPLLASTW